MPQILKDSTLPGEKVSQGVLIDSNEGLRDMTVEEVYCLVREDVRKIYAGNDGI